MPDMATVESVEIRQEHLFFRARDGTSCSAMIPRYVWEDNEDFERYHGGRLTKWIEHEVTSLGEDPDAFDVPEIARELNAQLKLHRPEWREIQDLVGLKAEHGIGQPARLLRLNTDAERDWYVPGLIARGGVTLVAGREKLSGKSTLLFNLIGSMERDERTMFGPAYGRPIKTLIVTEEPEYALRDKCDRFDLRDAWIIEDWVWPLDKLPGGTVQKQWEYKLEQVEKLAHAVGAEHVVIDPFSRIAVIEDESGREPGSRAEAVSSMAYRAKLAITIIHHNNKRPDAAVEDRTRGSTSLTAAVEQIVQIDRAKEHEKNPRRRRAESYGRVEETDWRIEFDLSDDGTTYRMIDIEEENQAKEVAKEARARDKASPDAELLATAPPEGVTVRQFLEEYLHESYTDTARQKIRVRLEHLVELGMAVSDKTGRERVYRLPRASDQAPT